MAYYKITPSKLQGALVISASKSHTLRAILFGCLAKNKTVIHNYLPSTDALSMVKACQLFGAKINVSTTKIEIQGLNGKIDCAEDVIDAGNSGIVLRFCAAIAALGSKHVVITGDYSIRNQRPMKPLLEALKQLGAHAISTKENNLAPVIIKGPMVPGKAILNGEDSQPVSALLIAAALSSGCTEIEVRNPGEKPWVALTLHWFDYLGIPYKNQNFEKYTLFGNASFEGFNYEVPGDFSSAAFPIVAAIITDSELEIHNLDMNDLQGDKKLIFALMEMGANLSIDPEKNIISIKRGSVLHGITIDINDFIDSITVLAVIACFAKGETRITNAEIARSKECNRIHCIATELNKMGADIQETMDGLIIRQSKLFGAVVDSYSDHRMAMSLAVAALGAIGETTILSTDCIAKTFPSFLTDFSNLGANIQEYV